MIGSKHLAAALLALASLAARPRAGAGDAARGKQLYQLCTQCHGDDGRGRPAGARAGDRRPARVVRAEPAAAASARATAASTSTTSRACACARWRCTLAERGRRRGGGGLRREPPPRRRPAPQLEGGDAARGQALYAPCTACHGADGAGNQALGSPPLNHQSDWYLLTQLQHFKAGVRGTKPGDTNGALMRPMSMILADEQAMRDVIAYIATLCEHAGREVERTDPRWRRRTPPTSSRRARS